MNLMIKKLLRESLQQAGKTYTMYHGSSTIIKDFSDEFVGGKEANDQEGPGIYFTTSLKNAMSYGENIYTVELNIKKSVSTQDNKNASLKEIEWLIKQAPHWKEDAQNYHENPMIGYKVAAKGAIEYNDNPHEQFQQVWIDFYRNNPVEYIRNMVRLGYDSIIIEGLNSMISGEENLTHIVVLNPSIIKVLGVESN